MGAGRMPSVQETVVRASRTCRVPQGVVPFSIQVRLFSRFATPSRVDLDASRGATIADFHPALCYTSILSFLCSRGGAMVTSPCYLTTRLLCVQSNPTSSIGARSTSTLGWSEIMVTSNNACGQCVDSKAPLLPTCSPAATRSFSTCATASRRSRKPSRGSCAWRLLRRSLPQRFSPH